MTMHLQRDLDNLRKSILLLGAKVEENINHNGRSVFVTEFRRVIWTGRSLDLSGYG